MAPRYKVWVQVERVDDEAGDYSDASGPICIGNFESIDEADERMMALGLLFDGLTPEEHENFHVPTYHETIRAFEAEILEEE